MARNNRDRVGRALEILSQGLGPFVDQHMTAFLPRGRDWLQMMTDRAQREGRPSRMGRSDTRLLLRVIVENPKAFRTTVSKLETAYAREIAEVANQWAHQEQFADADANRALDTIARLLRATGAESEAGEVASLLLAGGHEPGTSSPAKSRPGPARAPQRAAPRTAAGSGTVFLLMWHPGSYRWEEDGYHEVIRATAAGERPADDWTVGVRKGGIFPGDRAFLYRMYRDRGVVASAVFTSGVFLSEHWDDSGRMAPHARLEWETVLDYEDRLPLEELKVEIPEFPWDHIQGSGWEIRDPAVRTKLSDLWTGHVRDLRSDT